ncbi:MAG TPA: hypothetical protein VGN16_09350 [Acidobacteriaceae bacterium]|jgi:hypothetical protein
MDTTPKYKTGTAMKLPQESKPKPPEQPTLTQSEEIVAKAVPNAWRGMESAPKDGTFLYLLGDDGLEKEEPNVWYWYLTRQFRKGTWQQVGWWRLRFGPSCAPSFTPKGWRSVKEGLPA